MGVLVAACAVISLLDAVGTPACSQRYVHFISRRG